MVRPTIVYASTSWDPYKVEDVNCLGKVKRHAARYVCNNYKERTPGCVTAMVSSLGWESLHDHRKIHRLTMLFKVKTQNPSSSPTTAEHEGHRGFSSRSPMSTVYEMSLFSRTIKDWSKLPPTTTDVRTIEAFKTARHVLVAVSLHQQCIKPPVYTVLTCRYWNRLLYIIYS